MASTYKGIPLRSAIIVRHTPNDHRADGYSKNSGAVPMSFVSLANDYIARRGAFESKGDIEREATGYDLNLIARQRERAGSSLEYIARVGEFESKGADRQLDASLWNQYGPVSLEAVTREMTSDGGAFMDSIITVKREHAEALGLDTKEAMQRLVRETWNDSVAQWGLVANPEDIRWVASYHTDADRSLHVHIHTWSARGEIKPGDTVGKDATRRGKEIVYRTGYSAIRQERDARAAFVRDLSVTEAVRQLGFDPSPERERRLAERAEIAGWPERPSAEPDVPPDARERIDALSDKLKGQLSQGYGRLSDNYAAQATARDIVKALDASSPSFAALSREYAELVDAKAAMKGYGITRSDQGDGQESSRPSWEARDFAKSEMQDRVARISNAIIREHLPESERSRARELRADLRPYDARGREGLGNISFSEKLVTSRSEGVAEVRIPGSQDRVAIPERDAAPINHGRGNLAVVGLSAAYEVRDASGSPRGAVTGADLVSRFGEADMDRISRYNSEAAARAGEGRSPQAQRDAVREAHARRLSREERIDDYVSRMGRSSLRECSAFATAHGLPLRDVAAIRLDAQHLGRALSGTGVREYAELGAREKEAVDRIVSTMSRSRAVTAQWEQAASAMSERKGESRADCLEEVRSEASSRMRSSIVRRAESGEMDFAREGAARERSYGMEALGAVAELAEAAVRLAAQSSESGGRRRPSRRPEREMEREMERGRV